ncbi:Coenzyme F420 hydrogenase/dehydrogenase, beta subunit C-terminal domain [Phycisphaerales bacterium AB-hyl4]|uniref:Coenzyme F420 hydrogenase/dehydrogenase, beta subunit C-terminal domain n=1 Tax=Natronomicrosphaera hydrolytica TaxID=3242702 RepID=A0ABV4U6T4_9BACT
MRLKVLNIDDVAAAQLCTGCGVCSYISPDEIEMVDVLGHGRRPRVAANPPRDARSDEAMQACPGVALEHTFDAADPELDASLTAEWGPVLEVWEGYAGDQAIRHAGSSGGAATALALFGIEQGEMKGVLHTAARDDVPYLNKTVFSTHRDQLLAATGSRYAPASPCDGLSHIEQADGPCVFIGKPCDVAATQQTARLRPALAERLGLTIGFFCAGTPSTQGTLEMLKSMGVDHPEQLVSLRYRGNGWPGRATAEFRTPNGERETRQLTYGQSWGGILQKHRQWRCYICPDHTGEFADIAVGDPWYRGVPDDEPGRSLIVVRTRRGRAYLQAAAKAGYITLERQDAQLLPASQPNLLQTRGNVWGRVQTLRWLGVPAPRFVRLPMFGAWWSALTWKQKAQSFLGTMKRIVRRGLRRRTAMMPFTPTVAGAGQHAAAEQADASLLPMGSADAVERKGNA